MFPEEKYEKPFLCFLLFDLAGVAPLPYILDIKKEDNLCSKGCMMSSGVSGGRGGSGMTNDGSGRRQITPACFRRRQGLGDNDKPIWPQRAQWRPWRVRWWIQIAHSTRRPPCEGMGAPHQAALLQGACRTYKLVIRKTCDILIKYTSHKLWSRWWIAAGAGSCHVR